MNFLKAFAVWSVAVIFASIWAEAPSGSAPEQIGFFLFAASGGYYVHVLESHFSRKEKP